jgi:hypothetical protein
VKFIKFFAWEEQWIKRTLDAREVEIKWMVKGTSLCFASLTSYLLRVSHTSLAMHSSLELSDVLTALGLLAYTCFRRVILRICYTRERVVC